MDMPSVARLISKLRRHSFLLGALLVLGTLTLYSPVLHHEFLSFDDRQYVVRNVHVNTGLHMANLIWAFTTFDQANWHPLTWISHMADCQLFGVNSGAHHLVNAALHALNALLLFWLLRRATGAVWRSFFVAALFAVHPLNVATVAWLAERKSLLSALFSLLTIGAYGWYAQRPDATKYLVVALAFSLALISKPMAVTLPLVLIVLDYWPLRRDEELPFGRKWLRLSLEKLPLLAMSAASSWITIVAQRSGGAVVAVSSLPLSLRLGNAIQSYVSYIGKTFWPAKLAMFYPHPQNSLQWSDVMASAVILIVITVAVLHFRHLRCLVTGWFLFLVALVPVIGIVQVGRQAMADRYAYLPLLGIFIMLCWGVGEWAEQKHLPAMLLPAVSVVIVAALTLVARHQIDYWADNVTLWTHTIEVTAPNYVAQDDLAGALMDRKRMEDAIGHYREAMAIHPVDPISTFNLGFYQQAHGNLEQAIEYYKKATILTTSPALKIKALNNMGLAYRDLGDGEQARQCFDAARRMQGP